MSLRKDLNGGAPRALKHQEHDLGKLGNKLVVRNGKKGREGVFITSRSSFSPRKKKRRIPRGYYGGDKPRNLYQCICWARGPVQGRTPSRIGQVEEKGDG